MHAHTLQPAYLIEHPAILNAKSRRLAPGTRRLLGKDRQDGAQILQAIE